MRLVFKRHKIADVVSWCADNPDNEGYSFYWVFLDVVKEMLRGHITK